ncbi:MAG: DNA mismatch repair endonuclease MutL [Oscillospiraceae bacterium]
MPKINLLDKSVYELIAAGEVIERPASVIKELAENSIDAGAKTVTVEIKRGGITYIRVSDDGCGIAYEDIPTAFLRHATSKVFTADDLETINTLGFRGEALASVCAVGRVHMTSKRSEDRLGTSYRIEGGEVLEYDRTGCTDGTTIVIRDLFFNTPARLKFLKKDVTEGNYCAAVVEKLALSHPAISFRFIRDGKQTLMTGGDGEYYSAVYSVFGKQFAAGLVPVENIYRDISVIGYVSSPLATKKKRSMQHFFVNGRSVRSPLCSAALEEAFRNSIMVGNFPACVLCINIDPSQLDANISPTKTEVRFSNEKAVFDAIYFAVKNGLLGYDESREIKLPAAETAPREDWEQPREPKPELKTMAVPSGRETVVYPQEKREPQKFTLRQEYPAAEQQVMTEVVPPLPTYKFSWLSFQPLYYKNPYN